MSLTGHLTELRNRILISVFALLPGSVVGFVLSGAIVRILIAPLPKGQYLVAFGLTEPFMIDVQIAVTVGAIAAMPVILYQFWQFISPGLTAQERAAARPRSW
jgi:sec-independent protein translocase protein TatC